MDSTLILQYEKMVYKIAQKFYGVDREDLIQAGFLGLLKAQKNYNPTTGANFSTYAYEYIYGEMYEAATGNRPIRVRKEHMRLYRNVQKTKDILTQKYGREVSYEETTAFLGIDYALFLKILNSLSAGVSIENSELTLTKKENIDDLILLKESLKQLSPIEKEVITNRYISDKSQNETAKTLGLSQVKVSRLESASKKKMREFIGV